MYLGSQIICDFFPPFIFISIHDQNILCTWRHFPGFSEYRIQVKHFPSSSMTLTQMDQGRSANYLTESKWVSPLHKVTETQQQPKQDCSVTDTKQKPGMWAWAVLTSLSGRGGLAPSFLLMRTREALDADSPSCGTWTEFSTQLQSLWAWTADGTSHSFSVSNTHNNNKF